MATEQIDLGLPQCLQTFIDVSAVKGASLGPEL